MGAAEKLDGPLPFWPAGLSEAQALAYTGVGEAQMREWRRTGLVRFRSRGPRGLLITERAQLDAALADLFARDHAEDLDFGD